jgi:hypothetical protein
MVEFVPVLSSALLIQLVGAQTNPVHKFVFRFNGDAFELKPEHGIAEAPQSANYALRRNWLRSFGIETRTED